MYNRYKYRGAWALVLVVAFIASSFFVVSESGTTETTQIDIAAKPQNNQSSSWNYILLQTPVGGGITENLYDVAWCPGKNFSLLVGSQFQGGPGGGQWGLSYRLLANSSTFSNKFSTDPNTALFYGVDWRLVGDLAYVVGRKASQEYALWSTSDGTAFNEEFSTNGGDFRDVSWNTSGNEAIVVGYQGTDFNPGNGVIYKVSQADPGNPADITPAGLTTPLFTSKWMHSGINCFIGGRTTLFWTNGGKVWPFMNVTNFECRDAAFSPDDKYLVTVGRNTNNNSGRLMVFDLSANKTLTYYYQQPLYGVSWKSTGNMASISGDNGAILEYSEGTIRSFNTGTTRTLRRQCFMDPSFDTGAARYEYNLVVGSSGGGGGGGGARVIKHRQFDGANPAATDAADNMADAQNSPSAPSLQAIVPRMLRGYLDTKDASDCYQISVPASQIISVDMFPHPTADYGIKLYDSTKVLVKTENSVGVGQTESLLFDAGTPGGTYYVEIYRVSGNGSYMFSLNYYSNAKPMVKILSPSGGEIWTGAKTHDIKLSIIGGVSPYKLWVNYSTDGGATYPNSIVASYSAPGPTVTVSWAVPKLDNTQMRISVDSVDNAGPPAKGSTAYNRNFAVDSTPPKVQSTAPANNSVAVPVDWPIYVQFSEKLNTSVPISSIVLVTPMPPSSMWLWNATANGLVCNHAPLIAGTTYTIRVNKSAQDISFTGNNMNYTYIGQFTTFLPTPPLAIQVSQPNGFENWTTGTMRDITWMASGGTPPYKVTLNYSTDSGITWQNIVTDYSLPSPYVWVVPNIVTSYNCLVSASVMDSGPKPVIASDDSDQNFTIFQGIVTNNPYIVSTDPVNGVTTVPITQLINVIFTKAMNTSSVLFSCTPNPGGTWTKTWSNSDKTLSIAHTVNFAYSTIYIINITAGKDTVGNILVSGSVSNPWIFTTAPPPGSQKISYVSLFPHPSVAMGISANQIFSAQAFDDSGLPITTGVNYSWSITGTPAGVISKLYDTQTTFTATSVGACDIKIIAKHSTGTKTNTTTITVSSTTPEIDRVIIDPTGATVLESTSKQFTATAYNGTNILTGATYHWILVNVQIGTITGVDNQIVTFIAVKKGSGDIKVVATYNAKNKEATATITVNAPPVDNPPIVTHTPRLTWDMNKAFPIETTVTDDYAVSEVILYYQHSGATTWKNIKMNRTTGDTYTATIPASDVTGDIYYYIWAQDSGNQSVTSGSTTSPYHVVVSKSGGGGGGTGTSQFPSWVVYALIAIVILLVVLLLLLLIALTRRKKPAETAPPPPRMADDRVLEQKPSVPPATIKTTPVVSPVSSTAQPPETKKADEPKATPKPETDSKKPSGGDETKTGGTQDVEKSKDNVDKPSDQPTPATEKTKENIDKPND